MSPFQDQVILITGAANGIGRRLTEIFLNEGAKVLGVDLEADSLQQLKNTLTDRPFTFRTADVTKPDELQTATQELEQEVGPTDVVVANAGIGRSTPATDFKTEDVNAVLSVNLNGVANTVAAVLPGMRERRKGHIVAISSLASFRGVPHMAAYCASKAGVCTMMDSLRVELKAFNVAVTTICPGWIQTRLTQDIAVPQMSMLTLEQAVDRIMKAIRRRKKFVAFPGSTTRLLRFVRSLPLGWGDALLRWKFRQVLRK